MALYEKYWNICRSWLNNVIEVKSSNNNRPLLICWSWITFLFRGSPGTSEWGRLPWSSSATTGRTRPAGGSWPCGSASTGSRRPSGPASSRTGSGTSGATSSPSRPGAGGASSGASSTARCGPSSRSRATSGGWLPRDTTRSSRSVVILWSILVYSSFHQNWCLNVRATWFLFSFLLQLIIIFPSSLVTLLVCYSVYWSGSIIYFVIQCASFQTLPTLFYSFVHFAVWFAFIQAIYTIYNHLDFSINCYLSWSVAVISFWRNGVKMCVNGND